MMRLVFVLYFRQNQHITILDSNSFISHVKVLQSSTNYYTYEKSYYFWIVYWAVEQFLNWVCKVHKRQNKSFKKISFYCIRVSVFLYIWEKCEHKTGYLGVVIMFIDSIMVITRRYKYIHMYPNGPEKQEEALQNLNLLVFSWTYKNISAHYRLLLNIIARVTNIQYFFTNTCKNKGKILPFLL